MAVQAIDGSRITVDLSREEQAALRDWTAHIRYIPKYGRRSPTYDGWGLEIAPSSALSAVVESRGYTNPQRFSMGGGDVVIYDCATPEGARWAAWAGPWHMAHGFFYAPRWEAADVIDTLTRLRCVDTPDGLLGDPGDRFTLEWAAYMVPVVGVGILQVVAKAKAQAGLPTWRGMAAQAGEVYRNPPATPGSGETLMLVGSNAVVTLDPWDVPDRAGRTSLRAGSGTMEAGLDFLTRIKRVDWSA
ncbi:hypothetical protein ACIBHX_25530 [Nonomuraea sp. NPDC050536]|uniref:hypothetical protein n=1 Tax=Nonomuraea sp. NPDC050536 TaxID=3364366 RepID=UPI0037CAFA4E